MTRDLLAWVADGPGLDLVPEPLRLDEIRPGEVLVKVAAAGVCHTDIADTGGSRPAAPFPLVAGHEGAGVIAAVGPGVVDFTDGDRVVMSFSSCGATADIPLRDLVVGRQVRGVVEGDSVRQLLIPRLLELWRRGQLPVDKLVTTFAGTEVNEAMRAMENGHVVKPVVVFGEG